MGPNASSHFQKKPDPERPYGGIFANRQPKCKKGTWLRGPITMTLGILGCLSHLLQEIAALEVGIGVHDGVKVSLVPCTVFLDSLNICFVGMFEDPVASDMEPHFVDILSHST